MQSAKSSAVDTVDRIKSPWTIGLSLVGLVLTPDTTCYLFSLVTLYVIFQQYYCFNLKGLFFLPFLFQWLQINIKLVVSIFSQVSISNQFLLYGKQEYIEKAALSGNIGLMFLVLGFSTALRKVNFYWITHKLQKTIESLDGNRVLFGYVIVSIGVGILTANRLVIPGLNTFLSAFALIKTAFLILFFLSCFWGGGSWFIFRLVVAVEIVLGFTGYFSGFKDILLAIISGMLVVGHPAVGKNLAKSSMLFLVVGFFGILWTGIKSDYREFLSGGERAQRVVVEKDEALTKFVDLAGDFDFKQSGAVLEQLVDRISFLEFYSRVLDKVPNEIPHENGAITVNAIEHVLKPRILFPNKPPVDDSQHVIKYTGLYLASHGIASHSMGFMAELYIDYGIYWANAAALVLGFFLGSVLRWFFLVPSKSVLALVLLLPIYFLLSFYGIHLLKIFGNLFIYLILCALLLRLIPEKFFLGLLSKNTVAPSPQPEAR